MLHAYTHHYTVIHLPKHTHPEMLLSGTWFRFVFVAGKREIFLAQKHQADAAFADLTGASGVPLGGRVKSTEITKYL